VKFTLLLAATACIALKINNAEANPSYVYAILDNDNNEKILLNIPQSSVAKYPGWKYIRNGTVLIETWYPSLLDRVAYNFWISSPAEKVAAETRPTKIDRRLGISVGAYRISPPENTLDISKSNAHCDVERVQKYPYTEDGTRGLFRRYTQKTQGSASLNIIYRPINPIKGVYCMSCVENANCQLFGITDSKIPYSAFYEEQRMPAEALDIHQAVGKYLDGKTIK
jgi:hypothetical protein